MRSNRCELYNRRDSLKAQGCLVLLSEKKQEKLKSNRCNKKSACQLGLKPNIKRIISHQLKVLARVAHLLNFRDHHSKEKKLLNDVSDLTKTPPHHL